MNKIHSLKSNPLYKKFNLIFLITLAVTFVVFFLIESLNSNEKGLLIVLIIFGLIWILYGSFNSFLGKTISEGITHSIVFIIFTLFALSYLYIFFWGVTSGLKTHTQIALTPFDLPEKGEFHFRNYIDVFSKLSVAGFGFFGMLFNSLYFSVLGSFILCMMSSMLAYVTSKYRFPGSRLFMPVLLFTMTLPIYGSGGSMYKLLLAIGVINSYSQIILSFNGMNTYFLYFSAG